MVTPPTTVTVAADEGTARQANDGGEQRMVGGVTSGSVFTTNAGGDALAAAAAERHEIRPGGDGESRAAMAVTTTAAVRTRTGSTKWWDKPTEVAVTATRPLTRAAKRRNDEHRRQSEERAGAASMEDVAVVCVDGVLNGQHEVTVQDGATEKALDKNVSPDAAMSGTRVRRYRQGARPLASESA